MTDTLTRFNELSKLPYRAQAIWIMNGFYTKLKWKSADMTKVYDAMVKFIELDKISDLKTGTELDVFSSAKFLESIETAITAIARKAALKEIDTNSNGQMSLVELSFVYVILLVLIFFKGI
jgi:hypothetical protein